MRLLNASRRLWDLLGYDADFWRGPVLLGGLLAGLTWLVWYFTKAPCTVDNAASGLCNPNVVASFINVDIMSRCTGAWLGATTLTGGINAFMLRRERERADGRTRTGAPTKKGSAPTSELKLSVERIARGATAGRRTHRRRTSSVDGRHCSTD